MAPRLLATSDLHVNRTENEAVVEDLHPTDPGDWLIVGPSAWPDRDEAR